MDADIVLAIGMATFQGQTLIGQNNHHAGDERHILCRLPRRKFASGETAQCPSLALPQVRQTAAVLGCKPVDGWGLSSGMNEHQLAIATTSWRSRLASALGAPGADLARLALERCTAARPALDFITGLVGRHGQTTPRGEDNIFLIADPREAYLLETAANFWAWTECRSVRAVSNAAVIRQDWQRLAPGTAEQAMAENRWQCDGSKLDFAACLGDDRQRDEQAQKRWGRATYLLEEQNGRLDARSLRRILSDHFENLEPARAADLRPLCRHLPGPRGDVLQPSRLRLQTRTSISMICSLRAGGMPVAWCAFGPPCLSIYVPLFLDGELPATCSHWHPTSAWVRTQRMLTALAGDPARRRAWQQQAASLQARIDQETAEFLGEMKTLQERGEGASLPRQATLFMQSHVELLENALGRPQAAPARELVFADN